MGLVISRESVEQVRHEMSSLMAAHWHEVGQDTARMRLSPDWGAAVALESVDQLAIFTARADGELVGYAFFIVRRHFHYAITVAINDLLYLAPGHRAGMAGARLIREAEKALAADGVQNIYFGVKPQHDYSPLLDRRGYRVMETTWSKWVDD